MSNLGRTNLQTLYGTSGTTFPDNTSGEISEGDMRTFGQDMSDSHLNKTDDVYTLVFPQVTASGTDSYTATPNPAITAYATGQKFQIKFTNASTAAATLNLNLVGARNIYTTPTEVADSGDIIAAQIYFLIYDAALDSGTGGFLMIGGSASGGGGGGVTSVNGDSGPAVSLNAGDIGNTAAGNISATTVQGAINELDSEIDTRISAAIAGLKWKDAVRVATTANGTLGTEYENGDTVDGVVLATGNRILLKNQTTQTENGIYTVNASGAPTRAVDADTGVELEGAAVSVQEGTSNANTSWNQTTDSITLGVSNIVWGQFGSSVPDADASTKGIAKLYTSTGSGTDGSISRTVITSELSLKQLLVNSATTITDGATMDITAIKNTLATSSATRTFTISYTGDDITLVVTLSATSSLFTFPATTLCVSEGVASGNNTCSLAGVSGDKYLISIKKIGSDYYLACKNWGQ